MKYFVHLNLPTRVDYESRIRDFVLSTPFPKGGTAMLKPPNSILESSTVQLLLSHQICVSHTEIFYTGPGSILPIHVDGPEITNRAKLNFAYGSPGSLMAWYRLKHGADVQSKTTSVGTRYLEPEFKDCEMVSATCIRTPTLVNVGVPHSVMNLKSAHRYCLSLVLHDANTDEPIEFDEAFNRLKGYR